MWKSSSEDVSSKRVFFLEGDPFARGRFSFFVVGRAAPVFWTLFFGFSSIISNIEISKVLHPGPVLLMPYPKMITYFDSYLEEPFRSTSTSLNFRDNEEENYQASPFALIVRLGCTCYLTLLWSPLQNERCGSGLTAHWRPCCSMWVILNSERGRENISTC